MEGQPEAAVVETAHNREDWRPQPRIYVASLSDYNEGRLHGRWLDAARPADQLRAEVRAMLAHSPAPGAEGYAIHDHEGFGGFRVDEYESLETVSALGLGILRHGPAFGALASVMGAEWLVEDPRRYEESLLGEWPSLSAFVDSMVEDMGWKDELDRLPQPMRPYVRIDSQQLARDVQVELTVVQHARGVTVFDPRAW